MEQVALVGDLCGVLVRFAWMRAWFAPAALAVVVARPKAAISRVLTMHYRRPANRLPPRLSRGLVMRYRRPANPPAEEPPEAQPCTVGP